MIRLRLLLGRYHQTTGHKKAKNEAASQTPPQKNGVVLMVITPDKARDGISANPHTKTTQIDFAKAGCCPKRYLQIEKSLFRVEKPSSAPKNSPVNNVTYIIILLGLESPNPTSGSPM